MELPQPLSLSTNGSRVPNLLAVVAIAKFR